jgi:membrane peptidoglycan carboxypeptidase
VWIGYRNKPATLSNIQGVRSVTGGTLPASTWERFMKRAHDGLEIVKFSEPAPITEIADEAKREARGGFDVGTRRTPRGTDGGGPRSEPLPPPVAEPPPPPSSTTTTTTPSGLFDDP